jgi:hypothetical protein
MHVHRAFNFRTSYQCAGIHCAGELRVGRPSRCMSSALNKGKRCGGAHIRPTGRLLACRTHGRSGERDYSNRGRYITWGLGDRACSKAVEHYERAAGGSARRFAKMLPADRSCRCDQHDVRSSAHSHRGGSSSGLFAISNSSRANSLFRATHTPLPPVELQHTTVTTMTPRGSSFALFHSGFSGHG